MRCDRLCAAGALQHEELRQNRNTFQPDAESPEHLGGSVFVGEKDGKHGGSSEEVLDAEGVLVRVVGGLVVVEHQVDDVSLGGDEDDLEGGVPERKGRVGPQEIWRVTWSAPALSMQMRCCEGCCRLEVQHTQVSSSVYDHVKELALERDA